MRTKIDEHPYIMEHCDEAERLFRKTRRDRIIDQATWAGLRRGMRVLDLGCGAGVTTAVLAELAGPEGSALGVDNSPERIARAEHSYPEARFALRDVYEDLDDLGSFDFIWIRFFLEYHRAGLSSILSHAEGLLSPGGILCAADLDYNCLTHYPLEPDFEQALFGLSRHLEQQADWDPYSGRKLYTTMYDLGFRSIETRMEAHHLLYGAMSEKERENWTAKLTIAARRSGYTFPELKGGFEEFLRRSENLFADPRRFSYTPLIMCRGLKPSAH